MLDVAVFISNDNKNIEQKEIVDVIKNVGFNKVFINWKTSEHNEKDRCSQIDYIKEVGLEIIFAHLSYEEINIIWEENENVEQLIEKYINDITECKKYNIPMVIMHVTNGYEVPPYNKTGIERLRRIVKYAKKLNIKVAFENTRIKGYLEYILENIKENNVGICYDSGHCHIYFDDEFNFNKFKNKIFSIHLHDNDKSGDLHLLPFDATINWEDTLKSLKESNFIGDMALESVYGNDYLKLTPVEFYKRSYKIANKLAKVYEEI